jgi:hypothetical protein
MKTTTRRLNEPVGGKVSTTNPNSSLQILKKPWPTKEITLKDSELLESI